MVDHWRRSKCHKVYCCSKSTCRISWCTVCDFRSSKRAILFIKTNIYMYYKVWLENGIEMKMKCRNFILFFVGYFGVLAYGKFYDLGKVLSRIGNISAMLWRRQLVKCDQFWSVPGDPHETTFHRNPVNGLLRANGVFILDKGYHLKS